MSKMHRLRDLLNELLIAAAEEIFALFEGTIAEYEEELRRSKEENQRKQEILDSVLSPRVVLHRATSAQSVSSLPDFISYEITPSSTSSVEIPSVKVLTVPDEIKEEPEELIVKQEEEQLQVFVPDYSGVDVKPEESSPFAFIQPGNRGGKILVHEGHRYQKNKVKPDKIYWRCWRKVCNAYVKTNAFDLEEQNPEIRILGQPVPNHNHPDDTDVIRSSAVKQKMVEKLVADPSKSLKRVYNEVVADTDPDQIPEFSNVRSRLNRKRASLFPLIPNNVDDFIIENE
ncbi:hypothetical protein NL108_010958 [Boleophthalmus pectinirostris]|uniref:uncharacterized protein LOC110161373 isoform X2 n=1 Tax=Boleophthalmus pectinirostris TaxID=150288 RepID=UPI00242BBF90|nr:uncharacterized protein LOC110161373 isoform X2 [Boleophthalmus pectinirostris]KAJ0062359.1 hypothetical protein NL108_010958 [Boleophthalmus pectinirostris]